MILGETEQAREVKTAGKRVVNEDLQAIRKQDSVESARKVDSSERLLDIAQVLKAWEQILRCEMAVTTIAIEDVRHAT